MVFSKLFIRALDDESAGLAYFNRRERMTARAPWFLAPPRDPPYAIYVGGELLYAFEELALLPLERNFALKAHAAKLEPGGKAELARADAIHGSCLEPAQKAVDSEKQNARKPS